MNENDVEVMLQRTIEMKNMVLNYSEKLHQKIESIKGSLVIYKRAGLPSEIAKTILLENNQDCETINGLCRFMQTEHIQFLDNMIAGFNEILNQ